MATKKRAKRPATSVARPCWRVSGAPKYRFHYTQRDYAVQIANERLYLVSDRANRRLGTGLFTATIPPASLQDDDLLTRLFASRRTVDWIEGVLVLSPETPGKRVGPQIYFDPAPRGDRIDLTEFLIGICLRQDGLWTYSEGLLIST